MTDTAAPHDEYVFWRNRIDGKPDNNYGPGNPRVGFWRTKRKHPTSRREMWLPVAIWRDGEGNFLCLLGEEKISKFDRIDELFGWCVDYPISEEVYRSVLYGYKRTKEWVWPEDKTAEPLVAEREPSNAPPEVQLSESISELDEALREFIKQAGDGIRDRKALDRLADFKIKAAEYEADGKKAREEEKKPFLKAGRDVDSKWKFVIDKAYRLKNYVADLLSEAMLAERQRLAEAAAKKAEEGKRVTEKDMRLGAGTLGRVSLRTISSFEFTAYDLTWRHYQNDPRFWNHPETAKLVRTLAMIDLKAGREVPGAVIVERQQAV